MKDLKDLVKDPEQLNIRLNLVELAAMDSNVFAINLNNISDAFQFFKSLLKYAPRKGEDEQNGAEGSEDRNQIGERQLSCFTENNDRVRDHLVNADEPTQAVI